MKRIVYLSGLMDFHFPECWQWRDRASSVLRAAGFDVRSPYAGKKKSEEGCNSASIILRDRRDVRECDVMLVNLNTFGCSRSLLGTVAELAWAWEQRTPVVAICEPDNQLMHTHPFMQHFISRYAETEAEAVEFITRFYGNSCP